jgi:hypothetical protein
VLFGELIKVKRCVLTVLKLIRNKWRGSSGKMSLNHLHETNELCPWCKKSMNPHTQNIIYVSGKMWHDKCYEERFTCEAFLDHDKIKDRP